MGSVRPELHPARSARHEDPRICARRKRDHRLPQPSRLPALVRKRPVATPMTHDVEKRFDRPGTFHEAAMYVGAVVAAAGVVFAIYATTWRESVIVASMVPAILFAGGIGAFIKTYRVWKEEGAWPAWQGAGWFLLTFMLVCLSIPGAAMYAT